MKKYTKVDAKTKREIKKAYESGVDLVDLKDIYLVNYGTLRNMASKEGWIKGKSKQLLHDMIVQEDMIKRIELRNHIVDQFDQLFKSHISYILDLQEEEKHPTTKAEEDALKSRTYTLSESFKLAKQLYSIETPIEKVERELKTIELEKSKALIEKELKSLDNEDDIVDL